VAWTGKLAVAVGFGRSLFTSPDGHAWTRDTSWHAPDMNRIIWTGSQLIAVGYGGYDHLGTVYTSPDGHSWTMRPTGTDMQITSVASKRDQLVAVGFNGTILTSP
jgi:hypothetical protein